MAQITKEGELCVHCGTPVKKDVSAFKLKKLKKAYFYTHTLKCPKCKAFYMQERWKITREQVLDIIQTYNSK